MFVPFTVVIKLEGMKALSKDKIPLHRKWKAGQQVPQWGPLNSETQLVSFETAASLAPMSLLSEENGKQNAKETRRKRRMPDSVSLFFYLPCCK